MAKKRSAESDAESDNNAVGIHFDARRSRLRHFIPTQQPKRARVDDPPPARKLKGKQSIRGKKSGAADSSGDEDGSNNDKAQRRTVATNNDEDFEKENAERVKRALTQKQTNVGVSPLCSLAIDNIQRYFMFRQQKQA